MRSRVFKQKLSFLCRLLSEDRDSIATKTFNAIACQAVYNLSVVQQCIFLDSTLGTNATARILSDIDSAQTALRNTKKTITSADRANILHAGSGRTPIYPAGKEYQMAAGVEMAMDKD